jgi:hypothetical protein
VSELALEEDEIEVENKPAEGMSELPGATARVSPDLETFVRVVRQYGLPETTKAYVQKQEGAGRYTELRNQGLRNIDILPMFVNFEKLDVPITDYQEQGLSLNEASALLAQDMGVDLDQLRTEDGTSALEFLQTFAKGRTLTTGEAAAEGVARGATVGIPAVGTMSGAMVAAPVVAAAFGLTPPGAVAMGLIGLGGLITGGMAGQEIEERIFPSDPVLDPNAAATLEAFKTGTEMLPAFGLPYASRKVTQYALGNRGPFANHLKNYIESRKFNLTTRDQKIFEDLEPYEMSLIRSDPVFARIQRMYQENPKAFMGTELVTGAGTMAGSYLAERSYPGQMAPKVGFEIAGATFFSPLTALPYFFAGKGFLQDVMQKGKDLPQSEQEERIGAALVSLMRELGEEPLEIQRRLNEGQLTKSFENLIEDYPAQRSLLMEDLDIVMTPRQLADSTTLSYLEARLRRENGKLSMQMQTNYDQQVKEISTLIKALASTGDPDALNVAGTLRKRFFEEQIEQTLDAALRDQTRVYERLKPETLDARNKASVTIDNIVMKTFDDVRKQESILHEAVPTQLEIGQGNLLSSLRGELQDLEPAVALDVLPRIVQNIGKTNDQNLQALLLDQQIDFQRGVVARLTARGSAAENLVKVKQQQKILTDLQKDRAKLPDEFQPLTYGQRKRTRSELLRMAREAAAGENPSSVNSRLYGVFAQAILRDLHDVETIRNINNLSADQVNEIGPAIDKANAFSTALNDVFRRAFPNQILRDKSTGADFVIPELMYKKIIAGADDETIIRIQDLDDAIGFLVKNTAPTFDDAVAYKANALTMRESLDTILRHLAYDRNIMKPDPENPDQFLVDQNALYKFIKDNEQSLDQLPTLKSDLEDAKISTQLLNKARSDVPQDELEFFDSDLFFEVVGEKPYLAFERILNPNNPNPRQQLESLINTLRGAASLRADDLRDTGTRGARMAGLKRVSLQDIDDKIKSSIFDYALQKNQPNMSEPLNFNGMYDTFFKPFQSGGAPLATILEKEGVITARERLNLQKMLKAGRTSQEKLSAPDFEVERDLETGMDLLVGAGTRIAGSRLVTTLADFLPFTRGQGLIEANIGAQYAKKLLESIPKSTVNDVLEDAIFGPEAAENLNRLLKKGIFRVKSDKRTTATPRQRGMLKKALSRFADVQKLNAFLIPIIGDFTIDQGGVFAPDDFSQERYEELQEFRSQPSGVPRGRSGRNAPIQTFNPPAPAAAPPPQTQAAPPNPQLRQRYAALYPDDPISGLIEQQAMQTGIGTLPT